jgi:hypothetical protein
VLRCSYGFPILFVCLSYSYARAGWFVKRINSQDSPDGCPGGRSDAAGINFTIAIFVKKMIAESITDADIYIFAT